MKLRLLLLPLFFFLADSAQAKDFDVVFLQCAVSQGNGFNWASTLGWLSQEVQNTAERAEEYQRKHPKKEVGVDIGCYLGSSSSGFVTATLDQALKNPTIANGAKVISPKQALKAAEALRFLALSTDFKNAETLSFLFTGIRAKLFGLSEKQSNELGLHVWGGVAAGAGKVLGTFLHWVAAARVYQSEWRSFPLDKLTIHRNETGFELQLARLKEWKKAQRLKTLLDFPRLPSREAMRKLPSTDRFALQGLMRSQMLQARKILDRKTKGDPQTAEKILGEPLSDSFCVGAFAIPAGKGTRLPLDYSSLKVLYVCNGGTYAKLKESAALKKLLAKSKEMASHFLLASAPDLRTALNLTMREPGLLPELSGRLNGNAIGLGEASEFQKDKFLPVSSRSYLIVGGFPEARLQAWSAAALALERKEELEKSGARVVARLAAFAKIDIRDRAGSFAEQAILKYFTPKTKDESERLKEFHAWQDDFCRVVPLLEEAGVNVDFYRMDWNLSAKPAATYDKSYVLAAKGMNLSMVQADLSKYPDLEKGSLVFDPEDELKYLPNPPQGGMRCEP